MLPAKTGNSQNTPVVSIPDVAGLLPLDAALTYAAARWNILPVSQGQYKHPGSVVGKEWPKQSTCDPEVILYDLCLARAWDRHPGIALHMGGSHAVTFDLDTDVLPPELDWALQGAVQYTRRADIGSDRAHYVFASTEMFVSGPLKLKDGTKVGDIRSGNTVIIAEPSAHANPDGEYRWRASDIGRPIPPLPDVARKYLTLLTTKARSRGQSGESIEASDELVTRALSEWTHNARPKALDGPVNSIRQARSGTRNLTRNVLRFTASESRVGFYPLQVAVDSIRSAMIESYDERKEPERFDPHEFGRLVANGVGYAWSRLPSEIADEADRDYPGKFTGFQPMFKPLFRPVFTPIFYSRTV